MPHVIQPYDLKGDELLISVFHGFPKDTKLNFKDESNVMLAFYKASKNDRYSELFKNYHFDEDGIAPYSKEIADGMNILHQSSLMSKINPSFSYHSLSKGIDIRFDKYLAKKLSPQQKELLNKLSEELQKVLE